ncbi:MAG: acetolactate synthase [Phycisphaerae bacterium]
MALEPLETAEGHDDLCARQQSVFIENRVGQLLRLTRLFEQTDIRILAVSVVYSVDCAICRMILDDPDRAYDVLTGAGFKVSETELIVVSLPPGKRALLHTWAALLAAEINIYYTYPLLVHPKGSAAIAILTDNVEQTAETLVQNSFEVLSQRDLYDSRYGD